MKRVVIAPEKWQFVVIGNGSKVHVGNREPLTRGWGRFFARCMNPNTRRVHFITPIIPAEVDAENVCTKCAAFTKGA